MSSLERVGPIDPEARFGSVDAVRGFALFGVLLVNMYNFGAYAPEWNGLLDRTFSTGMHSLFETKSWRLFSLLFGLGFALQLAGTMSRQGGSLWFYYRRLIILFVFGMDGCIGVAFQPLKRLAEIVGVEGQSFQAVFLHRGKSAHGFRVR